MYVDEATGEYSLSWANLMRSKYPNTSFTKRMSDVNLTRAGIVPAKRVELPALEAGQKYIQKAPQKVDGVWTDIWEAS